MLPWHHLAILLLLLAAWGGEGNDFLVETKDQGKAGAVPPSKPAEALPHNPTPKLKDPPKPIGAPKLPGKSADYQKLPNPVKPPGAPKRVGKCKPKLGVAVGAGKVLDDSNLQDNK